MLWISTLPINSVEFAETTSILAHLRPLTPFTRNANGHRMASGAAPRSLAVDGRTEPGEAHCWDDSCHPDYEPDDRHCARCDGPMEYCHGHDTPDPILIPAPVAPVFIQPPATPPHREMARVRLAHATSPCWQLKLPDSLTKMTKIPSKYQHPLSSQRMKGLPKGWAYVEDNMEGRQGELRDPSWYGHLPPQLTHVQQHHKQWLQSNHPRDLSTTSGKTSSLSPSPTSTECPHQPGSSKSI